MISISFVGCEATWTQADREKANAQLRRAAELGVKVFTAAGDAGSVGSFRDHGEVRCGDPADTGST